MNRDLKAPLQGEKSGLFRQAEIDGDSKASPEVPSEARLKSSLRLNYEAQVRVIRSQIGDLEKTRESLGLSQRKMAQLLLVDPSAWTRWTKPDGEAPPHIWRALQWYLALREKIPGLTPQYFVNSDPQILAEKTNSRIRSETEARERQFLELKQQIREIEKSRLEIEILKVQVKSSRRLSRFLFALILLLGGWILFAG